MGTDREPSVYVSDSNFKIILSERFANKLQKIASSLKFDPKILPLHIFLDFWGWIFSQKSNELVGSYEGVWFEVPVTLQSTSNQTPS